jgi:hypothetical protein
MRACTLRNQRMQPCSWAFAAQPCVCLRAHSRRCRRRFGKRVTGAAGSIDRSGMTEIVQQTCHLHPERAGNDAWLVS